ncbi:MAG TPA: hypothetical protein VG826_35835 [Pirellulales bacterium]|nr:hypothetical protein [Pirellulales bacterium]
MSPRKRSHVRANWPTPEEIAAQTAAIRATWSAHQFRARSGLSPCENAMEIPEVAPGALDGRRGSIHLD